MIGSKKDIVSQLQQEILRMQGFKTAHTAKIQSFGLGDIEAAFPNGIFPTGAIHEFLATQPEDAAACGGFIGGLLSNLMQKSGAVLWVSTQRTVFPPALKAFGITPDQVIFIDVQKESDALWATEEALKCEGLAAVIAELNEISFTQSRRLQLVVEKSQVTGFLLRKNDQKLGSTASAARWKISNLPSQNTDGLPGLGFPRWQVDLLRVRNGQPGSWVVEWCSEQFKQITSPEHVSESTFGLSQAR